MVKRAFLFAGQGAQYVGMGKDLYEHFPVCRRIYDDADRLLGFSITQLSFQGPEEELTRTAISQPAIFVMSTAIMEQLKVERPDLVPAAVCGLSLGEINALVHAEVLSFQEGLELVRKRGALMEEAGKKFPGTMASIIGLSQYILETVVAEAGCQIANLNSKEQIVISGTVASVEKACELAREKGAKKAIPLKVSGAFHSKLMQEAGAGLAKELERYPFKKPRFPFIANVTAKEENNPIRIKELLSQQVTRPVRWVETIETIFNTGLRDAFEIGPGNVLKGLVRRIHPEISLVNLETAADITQFVSSVATREG